MVYRVKKSPGSSLEYQIMGWRGQMVGFTGIFVQVETENQTWWVIIIIIIIIIVVFFAIIIIIIYPMVVIAMPSSGRLAATWDEMVDDWLGLLVDGYGQLSLMVRWSLVQGKFLPRGWHRWLVRTFD